MRIIERGGHYLTTSRHEPCLPRQILALIAFMAIANAGCSDLESNDARSTRDKQPTAHHATADAADLIDVQPSRISWDDDGDVAVRLTSLNGAPFSIIDISPSFLAATSDQPAVAHEFILEKSARRTRGAPREILFTIKHSESEVAYLVPLTVRDSDQPHQSRTGHGSFEDHSALQIRPRRVSIGTVTANSPVARTVMLLGVDIDEVDTAITVESDHEAIGVDVDSIEPIAGGVKIELVFRRRGNTVVGSSDHQQVEEIRVVPGGPLRFKAKFSHGQSVGSVVCSGILDEG